MKNNNINYDNSSNASSGMFSDYDQYSPKKVPRQVNFKNPINYSNETNTIDNENIRNVNDILVNYGIRIENKHELIKEGVTVKDKPNFTDDLVVVTRKGISFTLNELDVRIRSLILDTTVPKSEIAALIVSEVSKYIPQDTENILETLITIKNQYVDIFNNLTNINNDILTNTNKINELNGLLLAEQNNISSIVSEINEIKIDIGYKENRIELLEAYASANTVELVAIKNNISDLYAKLHTLELGETESKNRITLIESSISQINSKTASIDTSIESINNTIATLANNITTNTSDILSIKQVNNSQTLDISSINSIITTINSTISTLSNKINTNTSDISTINAKLIVKDSEISNINNELTTIKVDVLENSDNIATITNTVNQHTISISDLINNISGIHGEITNIKVDSNKISGILVSINDISTKLNNTIYELGILKGRVDAIDPHDNSTATRLTNLEGSVSNINDSINNINTIIEEIQNEEIGEDLILTNNIKILNYKYYDMLDMNDITYVIKKNAQDKVVIKRVQEIGNYFDIRYSQPFRLDELPTKESNLEAVGYVDLSLINI